jgi:hypothetical protein
MDSKIDALRQAQSATVEQQDHQAVRLLVLLSHAPQNAFIQG